MNICIVDLRVMPVEDFLAGLEGTSKRSWKSSSNQAQRGRQFLHVLALEFLDKVVAETVIKVLTTQARVTSSGLDLEDTLFDRQKRDTEVSSNKIEDKNISFTLHLLVQTVGNGLVNTNNLPARNGTDILCDLRP
jgi:hypothetical protein